MPDSLKSTSSSSHPVQVSCSLTMGKEMKGALNREVDLFILQVESYIWNGLTGFVPRTVLFVNSWKVH